ncbi:cysteine-rich venom protein pseudecin [Synchiropus splendidus]|uniref:cysteine-rich venom protein pseudecin n=1 Tax=Synchiropus splendidus TaxID=270530 RepID=UPI00237EC4D8|nr:cysteine-rich venom protein pseudecin [Synchiropus splendidus]
MGAAQEICPENDYVQDEIVNVHNSFRRAVFPDATDMVMMEYDADIAHIAQAWVDNCILAHGPPLTRMLGGYELGENLFYSTSHPRSWTEVITAWHNEVDHYQYPIGSTTGAAIGHYTQVVWNTSYKVGCGVTLCRGNTFLYGCQYFRAGNVKGYPPYTAGISCAACRSAPLDRLCSPTDVCPEVNHFINCPAWKNLFGCDKEWVQRYCPASCHCPNKIISIL